MRRVDGDVVDKEPLIADPEDDEPEDVASALGDDHLAAANYFGIVVRHRPWRPTQALYVMSVGRPDQLGQPRHVGRGRGPE
jgi:hypothetical protein